jgi:mRNA interferase RelE/StbE
MASMRARFLVSRAPDVARRIDSKIQRLSNDLAGDVKRLTNFTPEFRLRVSDWRVLFDVDDDHQLGQILLPHLRQRVRAYSP